MIKPIPQNPAKTKEIQSQLDYFTKHQNTNFPFSFQINSGKIGKHLVFVGVLHGNEPAGVEAMIKFHHHFVNQNLKLKSGKITFVLGSPESFALGERFIDQNLNRAFINLDENLGKEGKPKVGKLENEDYQENDQNYETNRAKEFYKFFESQKPDCLLDFHSVSNGDFKIVIFQNETSQNFAQKISPLEIHFLPHVHHLPGSLMELAAEFGSIAIALECGNHKSKTAPDIALFHLQKTLEHFEMLNPTDFLPVEMEIFDSRIFYQSLSVIKPKPRFKFTDPKATTGTFVKKGEIFATFDPQNIENLNLKNLENTKTNPKNQNQENISNENFEKEGNYRADQDCFLMMPDHNPKITDFDAGFLCSRSEL